MTTPTLIARLEEAPHGTRELSDEVLVACDCSQDKGRGFFPDPTRNLQDGVDLVPEGWLWRLDGTNPTYPEADLWGPNWRTEREQEYISCGAATPALALVIAILKAMESAGDG